MMRGASPRQQFVVRLRDAFVAAGIDFVFLHNRDVLEQFDSDIDIAVCYRSLGALDTVLSAGSLGRLVQRIDYDVPWCRYYVLAVCEPDRRFRELDVACDPFGISQYGPSTHRALLSREWADGYPVPSDAGRAVYLAAKRARKGLRGSADLAQLQTLIAESRDARYALAKSYGPSGERLASALIQGDPVEKHLRALDDVITRARRRPVRLPLRGWFEARRLTRRVARPTGMAVAVAGPDGAGKTTLAHSLPSALRGAFRRYSTLHSTPGLLPPPGTLIGRRSRATRFERPHSRTPSGVWGSRLRVAYLAVDVAAGWWPRVAVPRIRSGLVVIERGWQDLEIDPQRYRLSAGARAITRLGRILPKPDLTLILVAPSDQIHARKAELGASEIARQTEAWRAIADSDPKRFAMVETTSLRKACEEAVDVITLRLAERRSDVSRFAVALKCLGVPSADGTTMRIVSAGGRPRWILPQRPGNRGPIRAGLYRPPGSLRHQLGAQLLELKALTRVSGGHSLLLDASAGLAPEVARALGVEKVELAALLPTDPAREQRVVFSILHRGRPIAIAKVAAADSPELTREAQALASLERWITRIVHPPRLIGSFEWEHLGVLITSILESRGRTDRPMGATEEAALVELALAGESLSSKFSGDGICFAHGDFCGWNSAATAGRLQLWDWEWAHMGEHLEDWFHWQTQRLIHFDVGSPEQLARSALSPTGSLKTLCRRLGVAQDLAPVGLAASLRWDMRQLGTKAGRAVDLRQRTLDILEGRARYD